MYYDSLKTERLPKQSLEFYFVLSCKEHVTNLITVTPNTH